MLFGIGCALGAIVLRAFVDVWAPASGIFALVYPAVLIATLYGHWQAGAASFAISFLWSWWFVLPVRQSFVFARPTDGAAVLLSAAAVLVVLLLAESFRRAVHELGREREAEIERRGMLLAELEHRTKNNFALVVSLLELQKRRSADQQIGEALDQAIGRVHTFASAYTNLTSMQGEGSDVDMDHYIRDVVERVKAGVFDGSVQVEVEANQCVFPRQRAVAVGLFINEALTNCAKHAFANGRGGKVFIGLTCEGENWQLSVRDEPDGGLRPPTVQTAGLGSSLMNAFAQQAEAHYLQEDTGSGRIVSLRKLAA